MTEQDFKDAADAIRNLRFMMASAIVACESQSLKKPHDYMVKLNLLQDKLEKESKRERSKMQTGICGPKLKESRSAV